MKLEMYKYKTSISWHYIKQLVNNNLIKNGF